MKRLLGFLIIFIFILSACGNEKSVNSEQVGAENENIAKENKDTEIINVIEDEVVALNNRDVEATLETYDTEKQTDEFKEFFTDLFKTYGEIGLTVEAHEPKVIYKKDNEAFIDVTLINRTAEFNPEDNWQNDRRVIRLLIKEGDGWKISSDYLVKITHLKEDGTLDTEYEHFTGRDHSERWDARIKELKEKDILPSEYLEELDREAEESAANDAIEIESIVKQEDEYFNERNLEGWNSLKYFEADKVDQRFMDEREEVKVKRNAASVEVLYSNGEQAIVHIKQEFRQEKEFDPNNNWNLDNSYIEIFIKDENEWKTYDSYILFEAWLLENGTEDPASTYDYNESDQLELVEKIKNEKLDPIETFNQYHNNNY
jgi:ketosteroid isomerase-like protein